MAAAQAKAAAEAKQKEKKKQKPMLLPKCCDRCFRSLSNKALEQTEALEQREKNKRVPHRVSRGITTSEGGHILDKVTLRLVVPAQHCN